MLLCMELLLLLGGCESSAVRPAQTRPAPTSKDALAALADTDDTSVEHVQTSPPERLEVDLLAGQSIGDGGQLLPYDLIVGAVGPDFVAVLQDGRDQITIRYQSGGASLEVERTALGEQLVSVHTCGLRGGADTILLVREMGQALRVKRAENGALHELPWPSEVVPIETTARPCFAWEHDGAMDVAVATREGVAVVRYTADWEVDGHIVALELPVATEPHWSAAGAFLGFWSGGERSAGAVHVLGLADLGAVSSLSTPSARPAILGLRDDLPGVYTLSTAPDATKATLSWTTLPGATTDIGELIARAWNPRKTLGRAGEEVILSLPTTPGDLTRDAGVLFDTRHMDVAPRVFEGIVAADAVTVADVAGVFALLVTLRIQEPTVDSAKRAAVVTFHFLR
ncbi:MAG: hypothetical protein CO108_25615 [Deltaproteobacteria bacterium CG_4_9_14_3_um_filter_63_12]|nr:MAG: hypothetical protein CO108_25615 [Deltaproteobacteria bacterium CG_4_9_14_3_um_filter_63_12]